MSSSGTKSTTLQRGFPIYKIVIILRVIIFVPRIFFLLVAISFNNLFIFLILTICFGVDVLYDDLPDPRRNLAYQLGMYIFFRVPSAKKSFNTSRVS